MAKDSKYLAFDFGAESGRALLGIIEDNRLRFQEIHRFPSSNVRTLGHIHWDILRLFHEVKHGLKIALQETGGKIDGIGVDTWGVDFGLIGEDGELLGNPFHYRDERTNGMMEEVFKIVPKEEVFANTGIQFMQLNTLYQLYSMVKSNSAALKSASTLLFMPDLFNYWLTGEKVSEFSIATTSQCYDPRKKTWATDMLNKLGIPAHIMPKVVDPGTTIGPLAKSIVAEMGLGEGIPVIAPAEHDTGSAVAAVPATDGNFAYLSSGTWSLMGAEIKEPIIDEKALAANFTNEGGVSDTIRFLHNIMGLWIVQECRRTWVANGENVSYSEITQMAAEAQGFASLIDPANSVFMTPGDMPSRIQQFCKDTNQSVPQTKGEIIRCALDSLALKYRMTLTTLEDLQGKNIDTLNIVGGGTQNKLLSQITANAIGRPVVTGPIEATASGNVLIQAMGTGAVKSLEEARGIVRNSFEMETYQPNESPEIESAYKIFQDLSASAK